MCNSKCDVPNNKTSKYFRANRWERNRSIIIFKDFNTLFLVCDGISRPVSIRA